MRVTIKVKIRNDSIVNSVSESFLGAVQYCVDKAYEYSSKHKYDLHHIVYKDIRTRFNLKAQFAINAIAKGFEAYKSSKELKGRKPVIQSAPVVFDKRLASFKWDCIRVATSDKRVDIPLNIPEYYLKYTDWNFQSALLIRTKKGLFFHIVLSKEVNTDCHTQKIVGVDLGVNNIAVTSEGKIFSGHKTKIIQYRYLRRKLQRKGTKSAKRLLRKVSGRQKRYMRDVNHCISKEIVQDGSVFVLENLTNIRKGASKYKKSKRLNRWLNSWSFFQFRQFLIYKAEMLGKTVQFVNPYMTSQTCSRCESIGSRYLNNFVCHCGFSADADLNASFNLRRLYVNQPNVPTNSVRYKPTNFSRG